MELRPRRFEIRVEDSVLDDLSMRLRRTRWPDQLAGAGWDQGTERETLRSLVEHWGDRFDWRAYEQDLNAVPQFKADVEGLGIHFVHRRPAGGGREAGGPRASRQMEGRPPPRRTPRRSRCSRSRKRTGSRVAPSTW